MSGYVYLARSEDGSYKIGKSTNPRQRMGTISTPDGRRPRLIHAIRTARGVWLERRLHGCFAAARVRGEWFRLTDEQVNRITSVGECNAPEDLPSWCDDAGSKRPTRNLWDAAIDADAYERVVSEAGRRGLSIGDVLTWAVNVAFSPKGRPRKPSADGKPQE